MKPERAVFDVNVIVSGLRSRAGAAFRLLHVIGKRSFIATVSTTLLIEYERALREPSVPFSAREIGEFLDYICTVSKLQRVYFLWRPFLRNPNADMLLELAVAGCCSHIVTFNRKNFGNVDKFGLAVITPQQFLDLTGDKE